MSDVSIEGPATRIPTWIRALRWSLLGLLLVSAALTLAGLPELREAVAEGRWPHAALAVPPGLLVIFVFGYAVYRFALVRAGRYPAGKALVQVALMAVVVGVVAGLVLDRPTPRRPAPDLERALLSDDPQLRGLAAELVRHRPKVEGQRLAPRLVGMLGNPDPVVRSEAHASLVALTGRDLGGPEAAARWRERWPDAR
ncbi:MAG: HEAT repeat domain-containing protein [Anaeromyxobacter sp.]